MKLYDTLKQQFNYLYNNDNNSIKITIIITTTT